MMERVTCLFAIVVLLSSVLVHAEEPEGLVLYYNFDTEDKEITDLSGTGNNAVIKGQPKWVEGKIGGALEFAASGQSLETPHSDSLVPDDAITIALWVNWSGENLPNHMIEKFTWQVGGYLYKMENNETNLWLYDEAGGAHMYRARPIPVPGEWTHLAVTFDGENQKGYVNGVSGNVDMPWAGNLGHVDRPLMMGAHQGGMLFTGMLDDVAIYNRALTEEEVLEVMENGHLVVKAVRPIGKLAATWGHLKGISDQ